MESPTKEIEEFESNSLKYLQPEQIEKIWLRLRGLCQQSLNCALNGMLDFELTFWTLLLRPVNVEVGLRNLMAKEDRNT
ncbi:hypothetical protein AAES_71453 [Amazona aestiva]|uniref:Uncharacterized protein n=1 Tax=Amazona aestiva TaxID=12930 RepID=A0A0Q3RAD2_AMAAE|nr:hypothetical protein AAES_71453 [Amazona aestiva]